MMVDPAQVRMARAALNWSHSDLARAAAVHRNTISNFETGKFMADRRRLDAIRRAFETAGVEFIPDDGEGPGVRLRKARAVACVERAKIRTLETNSRPANRI
jgi:transcriptional regulator with XRE-family HTH domain